MGGSAATSALWVSENNTWLQNSSEDQEGQKHGGLKMTEIRHTPEEEEICCDQKNMLLLEALGQWATLTNQDQWETRRLTFCPPSNENLKTALGPECHSEKLPEVVCGTSYRWPDFLLSSPDLHAETRLVHLQVNGHSLQQAE